MLALALVGCGVVTVSDLSTTMLHKCYCSVLARAIKLNLMVFAFAINFFSTATESCNQHSRHVTSCGCHRVYTATTWHTATEEERGRPKTQQIRQADSISRKSRTVTSDHDCGVGPRTHSFAQHSMMTVCLQTDTSTFHKVVLTV